MKTQFEQLIADSMMSSLFSLVRKRALRCMFLRRSMSKAFATSCV